MSKYGAVGRGGGCNARSWGGSVRRVSILGSVSIGSIDIGMRLRFD
jgi:hypothetical protein